MKIKNAKIAIKRLDFTATCISTKDASGDCIIEGYANTSTKDRVGDVVVPDAFTKSLPTYLKNPVLLANHDWNDPCGKIMSAEVTDKGLYVKARISDTRPDIKTLINEGCLSTFSIGYNEIVADFDEQTKTKYVKELELLEISVVTVPANIEASFTVASQKDDEGDKEKTDDAEKSAPKVRTAKELKEFIDTVKSVVGNELTGNEVIAVCEYFNNSEEKEIMTRKELIALLKVKSAKDAAPAAAPEAAKADAAAPADAEKPAADGGDALKAVMAKLDAIGQALAQLMEMAKQDESEDASEDKPKDEKPADEGKADKPADADKEDDKEDEKGKDKPKDEDEEMSDEDVEKSIAELQAEITALEDAENV